jgi:hypothetical protein
MRKLAQSGHPVYDQSLHRRQRAQCISLKIMHKLFLASILGGNKTAKMKIFAAVIGVMEKASDGRKPLKLKFRRHLGPIQWSILLFRGRFYKRTLKHGNKSKKNSDSSQSN